MGRRKRFTDSAGYTRHCWECIHATDWRKGLYGIPIATCELSGKNMEKYDSPNNPCRWMPRECRYETEMDG